jgi:non-ribosomal peptide synthetase component F
LGSPIAHEPIHLSKQLVARLTSLSRGCNATLFMTLLAGFKALLLARRGCTDICVATAMANRTMPWTERVLGPVENTTLIRTRIDPDLSFLETLSRVRNAVLEAYTRQQLPFEIVATRLANETGQDITSLLQALFVMQNAIQRPLGLPGLTIRSFGNVDREGQPVLPIDRTRLALMLKERASGIGGSASYKQDLFEGDEVRDWIVDYETILVQAAENPGLAVGRLIDRGDVAWQAGVRAHGPAIESRSR